MSLIARLSQYTVVAFVTEWLDVRDVALLDTSMCNASSRSRVVGWMYSLPLRFNGFAGSLPLQISEASLAWLRDRQLTIQNALFSNWNPVLRHSVEFAIGSLQRIEAVGCQEAVSYSLRNIISRAKNLESISVVNCKLTEVLLDAITSPPLRSVTVKDCHMTLQSVLNSVLTRHGNIEKLHVSLSASSDALALEAFQVSKLTSLELVNPYRWKSATTWATDSSSLTALLDICSPHQLVHVKSNFLTARSISVLTSSQSRSLTSLDASQCYAHLNILEVLQGCPNLTALRCHRTKCHLTDISWDPTLFRGLRCVDLRTHSNPSLPLIAALFAGAAQLEEARVDWGELEHDDDVTNATVAAIGHNMRHLQVLEVCGWRGTREQWAVLFADCPRLTSLWLTSRNFRASEVSFPALKALAPQLQSLHLCGVSTHIFEMLMLEVLPLCTQLRDLSTGVWMSHTAEVVLAACRPLERLSLEHNSRNNDLKELVRALGQHQPLLRSIKVDGLDAPLTGKLLRALPRLRHLQTRLTSDALSGLPLHLYTHLIVEPWCD